MRTSDSGALVATGLTFYLPPASSPTAELSGTTKCETRWLWDILLNHAKKSLPLATVWCQASLERLGMCDKKAERFQVYTSGEIRFFEPMQIHLKTHIQTVEDTVVRDRIVNQIIEFHRAVLKSLATGPPGVEADPKNRQERWATRFAKSEGLSHPE